MSKKIYKIKFDDKESTKVFVKEFDGEILKEKKKSVVVAAKDKDEVREMIAHVEKLDIVYGWGYSFGYEGVGYFIKKVADSKEEYKEENHEKSTEDEYER